MGTKFVATDKGRMPLARAWRFWPIVSLAAAILAQGVPSVGGPPDYATERAEMVARLRKSGVTNENVLRAIGRVPRHLFVGPGDRSRVYTETSIAIAPGLVLREPRAMAMSIQSLNPRPGHRILQVGCGSGYSTAVLCELTPHVYVIDLRRDIIRPVEAKVRSLGPSPAVWKNGRACHGWREHGPYDGILILCAVDAVPEALLQQLKNGGRMVIPVGQGPEQTLLAITKAGSKLRIETIMPVQVERMGCQRTLP